MQAISLVIPVYNEAERLQRNFSKYLKFLEPLKKKELVFVDDGSTDGTKKILEQFAGHEKFVKIISYKKNMGKGYAVKRGVLSSHFDVILVSDCDLSTPLQEVFKFEKYLREFDIVIGSRGLKDSDVQVRQRVLKALSGKLSNYLIRALLNIEIYDTQCGFKVFNQRSKILFQKQKINRFGFDFEILFLAKKFHFEVKEVGVTWRNDALSKVKKIDYIKTLFELFKIRFLWFFEKYETERN